MAGLPVSPVNAWSYASRRSPHDSGPKRIAISISYRTFIDYLLPVCPGWRITDHEIAEVGALRPADRVSGPPHCRIRATAPAGRSATMTGRSAPRVREWAVTDPELTLAVLRTVAAQRWKPVIGDERAVETEITLAISWSGPGLSRRFLPGNPTVRDERGLAETWAMTGAKWTRTAETPKQPSLSLRLRAPYCYPTPSPPGRDRTDPHRLPGQAAGTDTLILVTADPGQVDTSPADRLNVADHTTLAQALVLPLCGEPCAAFCYLRLDGSGYSPITAAPGSPDGSR